MNIIIGGLSGSEDHDNSVSASFILGYESVGGNWTGSILMMTSSVSYSLSYAEMNGYSIYIRSYTGIAEYLSNAESVYPNILLVMPAGSNTSSLVFNYPIPQCIVSTGAGSSSNQTGYNIEFFSEDPINSPQELSSFSNGYIAGQLAYIMDQIPTTSSWEARYRARQTATESGSWNMINGYGKIDILSAIAYTGSIMSDPFSDIPLSYTGSFPMKYKTPVYVDNDLHIKGIIISSNNIEYYPAENKGHYFYYNDVLKTKITSAGFIVYTNINSNSTITAPTINATSSIQLNGEDINDIGVLSNVEYIYPNSPYITMHPTDGVYCYKIYVDPNGDNSDGLSWATAFNEIQTALNALPTDLRGFKAYLFIHSGDYDRIEIRNINADIFFFWCGTFVNSGTDEYSIWARNGETNPIRDNNQIFVTTTDATKQAILSANGNSSGTHYFYSHHFGRGYSDPSGYLYANRWVIQENCGGAIPTSLVVIWYKIYFDSLQLNLGNAKVGFDGTGTFDQMFVYLSVYGGNGEASTGSSIWRGAILAYTPIRLFNATKPSVVSGFDNPGNVQVYVQDCYQFIAHGTNTSGVSFVPASMGYTDVVRSYGKTRIYLNTPYTGGTIKITSSEFDLYDLSTNQRTIIIDGVTKTYLSGKVYDDGTTFNISENAEVSGNTRFGGNIYITGSVTSLSTGSFKYLTATASAHGAGTTPQIVNVVYSTTSPPSASLVPEGTLFIKYLA